MNASQSHEPVPPKASAHYVDGRRKAAHAWGSNRLDAAAFAMVLGAMCASSFALLVAIVVPAADRGAIEATMAPATPTRKASALSLSHTHNLEEPIRRIAVPIASLAAIPSKEATP